MSKLSNSNGKLPKIKKTGGGAFDPTDKHIYFIASNPGTFTYLRNEDNFYRLIAVNELLGDLKSGFFEEMMSRPGVTFLDSGVFNLAAEHSRRTGCSHDEALKTPPEKIEGFGELYERYVELVTTYEDQLWGYVEIDIGGTEQKRKTRAGLEALGLSPIPVYHPLNDGWDYFDELASQYNRICVGNIVQASRYVRLRILATIWERKKKYPHLWVHLLGMTPNEWAHAYPMESMDSSAWLASVRWPSAWRERAALRPVSGFSEKYVYILGNMDTWAQALRCVAVQAALNQQNWRTYAKARKELLT